MGANGVPDHVRASLEAIDIAFVGLRRFMSASAPELTLDGAGIDMSTVLVVDVVSRRGGSAAVGVIATDLHVAPTTATRLVDRAQRAGVVMRAPSLEDGRRVEVFLTDAGRELDARALDSRVARLARLVADWEPSRIARFAADLEEFSEAAGANDREDTQP